MVDKDSAFFNKQSAKRQKSGTVSVKEVLIMEKPGCQCTVALWDCWDKNTAGELRYYIKRVQTLSLKICDRVSLCPEAGRSL